MQHLVVEGAMQELVAMQGQLAAERIPDARSGSYAIRGGPVLARKTNNHIDDVGIPHRVDDAIVVNCEMHREWALRVGMESNSKVHFQKKKKKKEVFFFSVFFLFFFSTERFFFTFSKKKRRKKKRQPKNTHKCSLALR
jgi:hypothetical protein